MWPNETDEQLPHLLQPELDNTLRHEMKNVTGDLNAEFGNDNTS